MNPKLIHSFRRVLLVCLGLSVSSLWGAENLVFNQLKWSQEGHKMEKNGDTNWLGAITWRSTFFVPHGHEKNRWVLEDDRAGGNFAITVNGKKIGECTSPFIRFELGNVQPGNNTIECYIAREYAGLSIVNPNTCPYRDEMLKAKFNPRWAWGNHPMMLSGGARIVELASPGDIRLAWAETSFREKKITIQARVSSTKDHEGILSCVIRDPRGQQVLSFKETFAFKTGEQQVSFSSPWENPRLWDVGQPNLYFAEVKLLTKTNLEIDTLKPFRFGFREVWVEGRDVMLNGHPFHARMDMFIPMDDKAKGLFKYLGRNTWYRQPHGNHWWGDWGPTPQLDFKTLDYCDENGIIVFFPATSVQEKPGLNDPKLHPSYKKLLSDWIDIYRNRPSIIAWGISMNVYNPMSSIAPGEFGHRETAPRSAHDGRSSKRITINYATKFCKEIDPTRLAYGHADGAFGDIASANCYPNMTPLQEVEDYPTKWAQDGDMPWSAVEYGVFDGSFFKDETLYLTEYAAIYFGEKAYDGETLELLQRTIEFGHGCRWMGFNMIDHISKTTDLYWDFMRLFTSGTDKYWRAHGVLAWNHFFWGRYGQERIGGWSKVKEPTKPDEAPEWATPQLEINRVNMQDLLGFIGGDTTYAEKTHAYYGGELFKKNAVVVWDGANPCPVMLRWSIATPDGKVLKDGQARIVAPAGKTTQIPIVWPIPKVQQRFELQLKLEVRNATHTMNDTFDFTVFPHSIPKLAIKGNVFFYDPQGKSSWVKTLLPNVRTFEEGMRLLPDDLLIVGREAFRTDQLLPYYMEDITDGARLLLLEQTPMVWEAYGFRMIDMVTRLVYPTPYSHPLMTGLQESDLRHWRGTPTLLPEYKHVRHVVQPPKGVNRHAVASTVFEIPNVYGFEPLFQCEFDLRYSPLLRFRTGDGAVYFSSFDFTDRVGVDPSATQLAANLLQLAMKPTQPAGRIVATKFDPKADILVNVGTLDPQTDAFLQKGGMVLNIALNDEALKARRIPFEKKSLYRVKLDGDLAKMATRNMARWRDKLEVNCITEKGAQSEGIWFRRGREVFLQVGSNLLEGRYDPNVHEQLIPYRTALLSVLGLDLLKSRVLTAFGAQADDVYLNRLNNICLNLPFETLNEWHVYGPFFCEPGLLNQFKKQSFPGEEQALRGDMNPNQVYHTSESHTNYNFKALAKESQNKPFDFRRKVVADEGAFINLTSLLNLEGKASFCYLTHLWKEDEDRDVIFSFSFPSRAEVYLNGEKVFSCLHSMSCNQWTKPSPLNAISGRVRVKKGENALTIKLVTLPKEWKIEWPQRVAVTRMLNGISLETIVETNESCSFYNQKGNIGYAYRYHAW